MIVSVFVTVESRFSKPESIEKTALVGRDPLLNRQVAELRTPILQCATTVTVTVSPIETFVLEAETVMVGANSCAWALAVNRPKTKKITIF